MISKCIVTSSWDDGHAFDLKLSRVLLKYGLQGTFFIPLHYLKHKLSKDDLIYLSEHFEIGSHTLTHPSLTEIPIREAEKEIVESKKKLEDLLRKQVYGFAYPKGLHNYEIVQTVQKANYEYARDLTYSTIISDPYKIGPSIHVYPYLQLRKIVRLVFEVKNFTLRGFSKKNWLDWARFIFDCVYATGGVYHLFGHSWEIENFGLWNDLEEILSYISNRKDVLYITNHEMVRQCHRLSL